MFMGLKKLLQKLFIVLFPITFFLFPIKINNSKNMEQIIAKLKEMVAAGTKKAELEEAIGIPKNSLSNALNSGKIPTSWIPKIEKFFEKPIAAPTIEDYTKPKMIVKSNGSLSLAPSEAKLKA